MPNLRAQASMHARQGQTPEALGARERARQDAGQARPHAGGHDNPPADRRASVRHAQGMDGQHPLPDQDPRKGQNRDEPAGAGLQYEATDQYLRRQPADAGYRGLTARACRRELPLSRNTRIGNHVFTRPRSLPDLAYGDRMRTSSSAKALPRPQAVPVPSPQMLIAVTPRLKRTCSNGE